MSTKKTKLKSKKKAKKEKEGPGGPRIIKGGNKGDYGTDPEFLKALQKKFGPIVFDLAANARNAVCDRFFSKSEDSLKQDWAAIGDGFLYLNPPFNHIEPWASKCKAEGDKGANVLFLVPASVGSKWFRTNIHKKATVYFLYGRLFFKGETTPYPKDCMLVHFHREPKGGYAAPEIWDWRKELAEKKDGEEQATSEAEGELSKRTCERSTPQMLREDAASMPDGADRARPESSCRVL